MEGVNPFNMPKRSPTPTTTSLTDPPSANARSSQDHHVKPAPLVAQDKSVQKKTSEAKHKAVTKKPVKRDPRLANSTFVRSLPILPLLSKEIPYLKDKLPGRGKFFWTTIPPEGVDWRRTDSIKRRFKPFSHLGQYSPPACLLQDAATDQDRLIITNWWRFQSGAAQEGHLRDLRNTYAAPMRSNRLLPKDYWLKMQQSKPYADKKQFNSSTNPRAPVTVPCQGWKGHHLNDMFRYSLRLYADNDQADIYDSHEALSNSLPLLFTSSKLGADLHFCPEIAMVDVDPKGSSTNNSLGAGAEQPAPENNVTPADATENSVITNSPPVATALPTAEERQETPQPTTQKVEKKIYVLRSRHCEKEVTRKCFTPDRPIRCEACRKHVGQVGKLQKLVQHRLSKKEKKSEDDKKVREQLAYALRRETRLRDTLAKYRKEMRALKKKEYRRRVRLSGKQEKQFEDDEENDDDVHHIGD